MSLPNLKSHRFRPEHGVLVTIQVPLEEVDRVLSAVREVDPLTHGDYDSVSLTTAVGAQAFRALGTGRNAATERIVGVPCVEVSLFLTGDDEHLDRVLERVYFAHPYEEPVIYVVPALRTLHRRGVDEDNPNRFWNRPTPDWVPGEHR